VNGPLLRVTDIDVGYGEVQVLWGVTLDVFAGEIVAHMEWPG